MISLDGISGLFALVAFVGGLLILMSWGKSGIFSSTARLLRHSSESRWTLRQFLSMNLNQPKSRESFLFSEESVVSVGYRYNGRFDAAILHWEEVPVLDAIIERKFPVNYLPDQPKPEDFFQAGLYALALMEKGVSCSTTKLVLVYCTQDNARKCSSESKTRCMTCSESKTFERRFKPKPIIKQLREFDEYWYRDRSPRPSPDSSKCRACPYGMEGSCNYSAV